MKEALIETFYPKSRQEWRKWLAKNHAKKQSIWLVQYKKDSNIPTLSWSDAVDEALCFGWIDSTRKTIDENSFRQYFTRRKPKSNWSKVNKEKILKLIETKKMMPAGLAVIETAKQNGSWSNLDAVEELEIPKDLAKAFKSNRGAAGFFNGLSKSVKKIILHWVISAKRPDTRERRIAEVATLAAKGQKPKQF